MRHWSPLHNRVNVRVIYLPQHGLVLHCFCIRLFYQFNVQPFVDWISFVGQLPCRETTCVQGLIGLSALSHSLLCFAYRAHPFPSISLSQEEGKTMMMMHPPLMDPAEPVILAARETLWASCTSHTNLPERKKEKDHTLPLICLFSRNHCWNSSHTAIPVNQPGLGFCTPIPQHLPQVIRQYDQSLLISQSFRTKKINMKVISWKIWKILH